jgi:hypothetical protein
MIYSYNPAAVWNCEKREKAGLKPGTSATVLGLNQLNHTSPGTEPSRIVILKEMI